MDIKLDLDNDLLISNEDFALAESEMQEVGLILSTNKGEWKENPMIGANLVNKVRSNSDSVRLERELRIQMQLDGKNFEKIRNKIKMIYNG